MYHHSREMRPEERNDLTKFDAAAQLRVAKALGLNDAYLADLVVCLHLSRQAMNAIFVQQFKQHGTPVPMTLDQELLRMSAYGGMCF